MFIDSTSQQRDQLARQVNGVPTASIICRPSTQHLQEFQPDMSDLIVAVVISLYQPPRRYAGCGKHTRNAIPHRTRTALSEGSSSTHELSGPATEQSAPQVCTPIIIKLAGDCITHDV